MGGRSPQRITDPVSYTHLDVYKRQSLVIAHRLSTIEKADEIVVVEDGVIVERGTHNDLLEHRGVYAQLHKMQFGQ